MTGFRFLKLGRANKSQSFPNGAPSTNTRTAQRRARPRKKVNAYSAQDKLKAIRLLEKTGCIRTTINRLYPDLGAAFCDSIRKLVINWRDRRAQIEAERSSSRYAKEKKARLQGHTTALPPEAEREVPVWVNELRKEGVPVSSLMLRHETIEIVEGHGITDFAASWCW